MDQLSTGRENFLPRNCDISIVSLDRFSSMIIFLIVILYPLIAFQPSQPPPHVWFWVWTDRPPGRTFEFCMKTSSDYLSF